MALPVIGDDEAAKKTVRALIDELGFDTVDAGGIDDSWRQQPDTPVYGLRAGVDAVTKALAEASPERVGGLPRLNICCRRYRNPANAGEGSRRWE